MSHSIRVSSLLLLAALAGAAACGGGGKEAGGPATGAQTAAPAAQTEGPSGPGAFQKDLGELGKIAPSAKELGAGFEIEGDKPFTRDGVAAEEDAFAFAKKANDNVDITGFGLGETDLTKNDFSAGLIRDYGNDARKELDDLKVHAMSFATSGNSSDLATLLEQDLLRGVCKANPGSAEFSAPNAKGSAGCDIPKDGEERIYATVHGGRFAALLVLKGQASPQNRALAIDVLTKLSATMQKAR